MKQKKGGNLKFIDFFESKEKNDSISFEQQVLNYRLTKLRVEAFSQAKNTSPFISIK